MKHTVLDIADSTDCTSAYDRNELQALYAMMTVARAVHTQAVSKHVANPQNKKSRFSARRMALWWQRRKQGISRVGFSARVRGNSLIEHEGEKNPQRAASSLMSHRPVERSALPPLSGRSGRRAPRVQSQQALFAVLDQMGARHQEARRSNLFEPSL